MKKVLAIICGAILFGVLAGGTLVGISALSLKYLPAFQTEESAEAGSAKETEAVPQTEAETKSDDKQSTGSNSSSGSGVQALDVSGIVEETMPQVVSITNTMLIQQQGYSSIFDYFYGGGQVREYEAQAAGSGVIVKETDDELLIVTNNHVVENAQEISVTFIDGTTIDAAIKGTDSTVDLAVVAVPLSDLSSDTLSAIKVATLHDDEDLKPGQGVIAIGNALGFGQSVTVGYISALDREITTEEGTNSNLIQVDAAINPGNSGGALLNMDGELIGINVAKLANTKVEGIGYAIPIYKAMDVIDNLSNAKTRVEIDEDKQGRLGIYVKTISESYADAVNMPEGVLVYGFDNENGHESAAEKAGILKNDIIVKFDGQSVETAEDLTKLVKYYEAGSTVSLVVKRLENGEYQEKTIDVTLGKNYSAETNSQQNGNQGNQGNQGWNGNGGQMPWQQDFGNGGRPQPPQNDQAPQDGQNPQNDQNGAQDSQGADNENGQNGSGQNGSGQDGNNQDGNTQNGNNDSDMYDLFKQFMEQYQ